jgi:2-hydroxychromene-2-carboxylate isomerase
MSMTVEFVFDFASPNAYLAYRAIGPVLERTGARLQFLPCLLGGIFKATGNQPPLMAFADVPAKVQYMTTEMTRFAMRHHLTRFEFNPHFPVNTLLLMRGAIAAQRRGEFEAYLEMGLAAMWENGLKMDEPEVFVAAANAAGLDGPALLAETQDPDVKAALAQNTAAAVARGVFGIPTFLVGDELFFGKDSLADLEFLLGKSDS